MKSLFITFEGIEGCGKSTQAKLLSECLLSLNRNVLLTREPGGPGISEKIRHLLLDPENTEMTAETEVLLYMASRAQHTAQWIIPALKENTIVICDRYFDSSFAYQVHARKLNNATIQTINSFATQYLVPDLTIYIDIPLDEGFNRIKNKNPDRLENESYDFHKAVRNGFEQICSENPHRFIRIDGMQSIDLIHNKIKEIVLCKIQKGTK